MLYNFSKNEANIYRPKEHCRLVLQDPDEQKLGLWDYQVTKLFWSKVIHFILITPAQKHITKIVLTN